MTAEDRELIHKALLLYTSVLEVRVKQLVTPDVRAAYQGDLDGARAALRAFEGSIA